MSDQQPSPAALEAAREIADLMPRVDESTDFPYAHPVADTSDDEARFASIIDRAMQAEREAAEGMAEAIDKLICRSREVDWSEAEDAGKDALAAYREARRDG